jgi:hypothetical protein
MPSITYIYKHLYETDRVTTDERNVRGDTIEADYLVTSSVMVEEDDVLAACRSAVGTSIPSSRLSCALARFQIKQRVNALKWIITAIYEWRSRTLSSSSVPDDVISYDFTTVQVHIDRSLSTIHRYGNAPNVDGRINVQGDQTRGCDSFLPCATLNITHYLRPTSFTQTLRNKITYRIGRVNDAPFKGYAEGELLMLRSPIRRVTIDGQSLVQIDFSFAISENESNVSIGSSVSNISKEGWQYLWTHLDPDDQMTIDGAYVEKVYKKCDFTEMGLTATGAII